MGRGGFFDFGKCEVVNAKVWADCEDFRRIIDYSCSENRI